ncbi:zinc finger, CCHC-type containing protein [Tanacetum coccineum]|uniref:Zinc finger, CCHC-type containing protein n=1 Tax=Tanacetum coccineum TaxID=301880 RepID=A0ABQ5DZE2_9ASTR
MTTQFGNNFGISWSFFEKTTTTEPNIIDWYKQPTLVLSTEDKEYYLEHPIPVAPVAQPGQQIPPEDLAAHAAWVKGQKEVAVLMLLTMDLDIQRNLAHLGAYDMLQELKAMFSKQAEQELLQTVREFHTCKQEEGQSVSSHVLKMKGYIDNFGAIGPTSWSKPAIRAGRVQKNQKNKPHKAGRGGKGKGKNKMGYAQNNVPFAPKPKTPPPPKKDNPAKDAICHQYGELGTVEGLGAVCGGWGVGAIRVLSELMKKGRSYLREQVALVELEDLEVIRRRLTNPSVHKDKPSHRLIVFIHRYEEHKLGDLGEPANYKAALLDPESKKWLDAINVEMQSMKDNDVWVLLELPSNARTVGSKWLFKKKTDMDGAVYIFKARLVAKGFTQTYGVDYEETFSPVADIRAIRILIAIAAYYDYEICKWKSKPRFLNGHLS